MKRYIQSTTTLADYAESNVANLSVSENDYHQLMKQVNLDHYNSLQHACRDLVNVIEDDQLFSEIEYNLMHDWYSRFGFTDDDARYVKSCGYDVEQF